MSKTAIITGVSGQDGAYLSKLLLTNGYNVIGLVRSHTQSNLNGLNYLGIINLVKIEECGLSDISQVIKILGQNKPDEIYNLAAQSSVSLSFRQPISTFSFNTISVFNLLEAVKIVNNKIKIYQASSSEMFGYVRHLPIAEDTEFHPKSPYAISKAAGHWTCVNYMESYKMFVCCGILFNHESYLRNKNFFMKKVVSEAVEIKKGKREVMEIGNLDIKRDFGYAPKYVEAMYLMMQKETPANYLISSGHSVSLRYIVEYIFDKLNLNKDRITISKDLYRPADINDIYGNPEKAKVQLGWEYDITIEKLLDTLLDEELINSH